MNEQMPLWPCWVLGATAAVLGGICLALGIDPGWAAIGTCLASIPVILWVEFNQATPKPQPDEVDEEFVRRLEALASRMRQELEERRAAAR